MPASTLTRAVTEAGRTDSRYASSCSSNHSTDGIETRRVGVPAASSCFCASAAYCTSEPVAMRITCGSAEASFMMYPPLTRFSALAYSVRSKVGVGRAHDRQVRDGPVGGQVLDRLVGGAVLAQADRVVRPHVGGRDLHQRGETDRAAHVVRELEEGASVGTGQPVQGDAGEDRAHAVLADAEVQRAAELVTGELGGAVLLGQEGGLALHRGVVRAGQVGAAAPQLGHHSGEL